MKRDPRLTPEQFVDGLFTGPGDRWANTSTTTPSPTLADIQRAAELLKALPPVRPVEIHATPEGVRAMMGHYRVECRAGNPAWLHGVPLHEHPGYLAAYLAASDAIDRGVDAWLVTGDAAMGPDGLRWWKRQTAELERRVLEIPFVTMGAT